MQWSLLQRDELEREAMAQGGIFTSLSCYYRDVLTGRDHAGLASRKQDKHTVVAQVKKVGFAQNYVVSSYGICPRFLHKHGSMLALACALQQTNVHECAIHTQLIYRALPRLLPQ